MHGYGIAQRLKQLSEDVLQVGELLYPALQRLLLGGYLDAEVGALRAATVAPATTRSRRPAGATWVRSAPSPAQLVAAIQRVLETA